MKDLVKEVATNILEFAKEEEELSRFSFDDYRINEGSTSSYRLKF
jgi:hypothetical protein